MKKSRTPFFYRGTVLALLGAVIIVLWLAWFAFLITSDATLFATALTSFEATGQFGDSFGFLASFMSTMAVIGALFSIHLQRRNYERQQFEQNFYTLLGSVRRERDCAAVRVVGKDRVSDTIYDKASYDALRKSLRLDRHAFEGVDAVRIQVLRLRDAIGIKGFADTKIVAKQYRFVMKASGFGNYFRLMYHLYKMIDNAPVRDKDFYAQILRAHLSSGEGRLIAYNCIVGEGRHKFRNLVEKYSVLHNIGRSDLDAYGEAELSFFQGKLGSAAFRFDEDVAVTY